MDQKTFMALAPSTKFLHVGNVLRNVELINNIRERIKVDVKSGYSISAMATALKMEGDKQLEQRVPKKLETLNETIAEISGKDTIKLVVTSQAPRLADYRYGWNGHCLNGFYWEKSVKAYIKANMEFIPESLKAKYCPAEATTATEEEEVEVANPTTLGALLSPEMAEKLKKAAEANEQPPVKAPAKEEEVEDLEYEKKFWLPWSEDNFRNYLKEVFIEGKASRRKELTRSEWLSGNHNGWSWSKMTRDSKAILNSLGLYWDRDRDSIRRISEADREQEQKEKAEKKPTISEVGKVFTKEISRGPKPKRKYTKRDTAYWEKKAEEEEVATIDIPPVEEEVVKEKVIISKIFSVTSSEAAKAIATSFIPAIEQTMEAKAKAEVRPVDPTSIALQITSDTLTWEELNKAISKPTAVAVIGAMLKVIGATTRKSALDTLI